MKPETAAFLDASSLPRRKTLAAGWPDEAGRAAYLAGLHAAQALIVERTGRVIKRHRGVQSELRRLTKDEPLFESDLRARLRVIVDVGRSRANGCWKAQNENRETK